MANLSPQVVIKQQDMSTYSVVDGSTTAAFVGYGTRGPLNTAKILTSYSEFVQTFGTPPVNAPWAHLAVKRAFNQTNKVVYMRVADDTLATAAERLIRNYQPATSGYADSVRTSDFAEGTYTAQQMYALNVNVDSGGVEPVYFVAPSSGRMTLGDIALAIDTNLGVMQGFLEFAGTFTAPSSTTTYEFQLNVDGTKTSDDDITVTVLASDTIETFTSKLQTAIYASTYGTGTNFSATDITVSLDSETGNVRLTSQGTAASSSVVYVDPDGGTNLATLFGDTNAADLTTFSLDGRAAIGASASYTSGKVRIVSDTTGTSSTVAITAYTASSPDIVADANAILGGFTPTAGVDEIIVGSTDNIKFVAKETGSYNNNITIEKTTTTNSADGTSIYSITITDSNGTTKEIFDDVSFNAGDDNYFVSLINADEDNGGSKLVSVEVAELTGDDPADITFPNGVYQLGTALSDIETVYTSGLTDWAYDYKVGTDGVATSEATEISLFMTALSSGGDLGNKEVFDFHLLATPDTQYEAIQNEAISLAESRKDFLYIVDPPFGLTYSEVADYHNGSGGHGRSSALNTSFATLYWSWQKDFNSSTRQYIDVPPSVYIVELLLKIDNNYHPWSAPAGATRGVLITNGKEASPSQSQRDVLYGGFNAVNPIADFIGKGTLVYGQKTLLRQNSALNRLNVVRMVIYIRKLMKQALDSLLFEPALPATWQAATNRINNILEPIRQTSGLSEYRVVIDASTNPPEVQQQNMMKGVVKIVPVGTVEVIEINLITLATGSTIS